jgi:hypothetical protein
MLDAKTRGDNFRAFVQAGTPIGPHDCYAERHEMTTGALFMDASGNVIMAGPPVLDIHYHVCCPVMRHGRPQCP